MNATVLTLITQAYENDRGPTTKTIKCQPNQSSMNPNLYNFFFYLNALLHDMIQWVFLKWMSDHFKYLFLRENFKTKSIVHLGYVLGAWINCGIELDFGINKIV